MGYDEKEESLRAEALRVVPGVMAAKARNDMTGAAHLIDDYHVTATKLGIADNSAWNILWSATLHWAMELAEALADSREIGIGELLQTLGYSALSWMNEERGVGGY